MRNNEIRTDVSLEEFAGVYKVFSGAPFFEAWTPEMVSQVYHSFDVPDAKIFGFYSHDKCVAILALRPMVDGEHPVSFDSNHVMYLAEVATLPEHRRRGIATELFYHGIHHAKVLGYDYIYLRTNEKKNSMSYAIAEKCGFNRNWKICQEVDFPRTRRMPSTDLRVFLEMKL